jgi:hypoxanthine phosphoribosyltransferase
LVADALTWHAVAVPELSAADPYPGDIESVLLSQAAVQARVAELGAEVGAHYGETIGEGGEDLLLVTVLKGAVMFVTDLARAIPLPTQLEFMAVSSYGSSTSSSGVVRILKDLDRDINDRDVLIVEDIVDSGLTLKWLLRNLATRHPRSLKVCALLRKPDAVRVDLDLDFIGFDIPNEFVVGYGLDYAERYRDLPYIGLLDPKVYENP